MNMEKVRKMKKAPLEKMMITTKKNIKQKIIQKMRKG
jgi:hypothetical protein